MSISIGNSKLGKIPNISLIPIRDCKNCKSCRDLCYAKRFYKMYPSVKKSWDENSYVARENPAVYFEMIDSFLYAKKPKYFRWHVGGDILSQMYLDEMISLAGEYKNTKFLCFTKRFDLDYSGIVKNLSILFSIAPGIGNIPTHPETIKLSWIQDGTENRIPENAYECPGSCSDCKVCWNKKVDVVFHKH